MNKTSVASLVIALVALVSVFTQKPEGEAGDKTETVYERVLRTGTLRCGYALWPQFVMKDLNTGAMSGAEVDYLNEIGKALGVKVEWTETGYGEFIEALNVNKVDMMCGIWPSVTRAKQVDFSRPIEYTAIVAFVRADDTRFDADLRKLDDQSFTIATIDGEMASFIAQENFPKAKTLSLPQLSDNSVMLTNVADGKADVSFLDVTFGMGIMEKNPGKLKMVHPKTPLRIGANTLAVKKGQQDLLNTVNTITEELLSSGVVERILTKYEKYPGSFYRVSKPFETKLGQGQK